MPQRITMAERETLNVRIIADAKKEPYACWTATCPTCGWEYPDAEYTQAHARDRVKAHIWRNHGS